MTRVTVYKTNKYTHLAFAAMSTAKWAAFIAFLYFVAQTSMMLYVAIFITQTMSLSNALVGALTKERPFYNPFQRGQTYLALVLGFFNILAGMVFIIPHIIWVFFYFKAWRTPNIYSEVDGDIEEVHIQNTDTGSTDVETVVTDGGGVSCD